MFGKVLIAVAIFSATTICSLGKQSARGDEFGTIWMASQESAWYIIEKIWETDVHPPGHYLFLHYVGKVFGYSDFSMRLPSFIFVLLSLVVAWRLIILFIPDGTAKGKLTVFLLCATAPALWVLGSVARYYSAGMF